MLDNERFEGMYLMLDRKRGNPWPKNTTISHFWPFVLSSLFSVFIYLERQMASSKASLTVPTGCTATTFATESPLLTNSLPSSAAYGTGAENDRMTDVWDQQIKVHEFFPPAEPQNPREMHEIIILKEDKEAVFLSYGYHLFRAKGDVMGRIHYENNIGPNSSLVYLLGGTEFQRRLKKKIVDLKTQLEKGVKGGTEDQRKLKVNKVLEQVLEKVPVFNFCTEIMLEALEVAKLPLWLQGHKDKLRKMLQAAPTQVIAKAYMPQILHMFEEPLYLWLRGGLT